MKRNHILPLLFLSVTLFPLSSGASVPSDASGDGYEGVASSMSPANTEYACKEGEPIDISFMGLRLSADAGSLIHDMTLQAEALPMQCGHPMPSSMKNVSTNGDGVRLLPNGVHFAEEHPAHIILAYDPQRLPIGHSADEIYTFCCEERGGQWHKLERVAIDTIAHTVTSITIHFTDFANAIISLPELPESSAYVPTTLTDMPDPDPLQGIPMVQVNGLGSFGSPTGDNSGSASLTYPIEIPAGRHGLQPDVSLHYNSANGNGPLGVGWSLPMPAVTIDTRWGVPRYDYVNETEAYLVNGEPIIMHDNNDEPIPLPHQATAFERRSRQTKRFWFRNTENNTRVIRHGRLPYEYWWEVTTASGITYYYGRLFDPLHPENAAIDENSVLRNADSCIGYWALSAVVDLYGNYILYKNHNTSVTNNGLSPHTEGDNVYTDSILYTGNHLMGTAPTYAVKMSWMSRSDDYSDGRLGMLRLTDKLLCNIGVLYKDTIISSYFLSYECSSNSLWKSRLSFVDKSDESNSLNTCDFLSSYLSNHHTGYAGSRTTFSYKDAPQAMFGQQPTSYNTNSPISMSQSGSWNIGGTATVGWGPNPAMTTLSVGGHYNFSQNFGRMRTMLMDINGDGLPDLVYQSGNSVKYRPQIFSGSPSFGSEITIQGLPRLSRDVSRTHNWGLQLSFGAELSYSNPITLAYTDYYFTDINADGLPDMVTPDGILFNRLNNAGHPTFSLYSGSTVVEQNNSTCPDGGINYTGVIDNQLECDVFEVAEDSIHIDDIPTDPGWTEPNFPGHDPVETGKLTASDWDPLPTDNDWGQNRGEERLQQDVASEGEKTKTPAMQSSKKEEHQPDDVVNQRGGFYEDGYIYRIHNGWIVKYSVQTICKDENPDPTIETVRVWVAPADGYVYNIMNIIGLKQDTSFSRRQSRKADGVKYVIQLNKNNATDSGHEHFTSTNVSILKSQDIYQNNYTIDTSYINIGDSVHKGDIILFRLKSRDNNLYDDVNWKFRIVYYSTITGTRAYESDKAYICTGNRPFTAPCAGQAIIRYKWRNENSYSTGDASLSFAGCSTSAVTLAHNDSSSGNYVIFGTECLTAGQELKPVVSVSNPNTYSWSKLHIYPQIEFRGEYPSSDNNSNMVRDTSIWYPDMPYPCPTLDIDSTYSILFGPLYECMGRFAYHPQTKSDTLHLCSLINTERQGRAAVQQDSTTWKALPIPQDVNGLTVFDEDSVGNLFTEQGMFNPLSNNSTWVPIYPDSRTERWIPYGNMGTISRSGQSNSRNMETTVQQENSAQQMASAGITLDEDIPYYDSAIPKNDGTSTGRDKSLRKSSKSVQHCLAAGALIMNATRSWGTYKVETDFIDMNGDGFPDAVGPSGIQYSLPWGGLGVLVPAGIEGHQASSETTGLNLSGTATTMKKLAGNSVSKSGSTLDGSGAGISHNSGTDNTDRSFVDINGDGLPDIVSMEDQTVRYNLGYRFTEPAALNFSSAFISNSTSTSGGISGNVSWMQDVANNRFNISQYSISGGLDVSISQNMQHAQLTDMNGDGLPDLVRRTQNGNLQVAYNYGTSFRPYVSLVLNSPIQNSLTWSLGASVSGTLGFTFAGVWKVCVGLQGGGGYSETRSDRAFIDMNADGLPDLVWCDSSKINVCYNQAAGTNLLREVTNPTGQELHMEYTLTAPTQKHRQRQWYVDYIEDIDNENPWAERIRIETMRTCDSAYYDNHERTDYGFAKIVTNESGIRKAEEIYHINSYRQKGKKVRDILKDEYAKPYIGHRYGYSYKDADDLPSTPNCNDAGLYADEDSICTDYYEGGATPQITTRVRMRYDNHHNLTEYYDDGDIADGGDDWQRKVAYLPTEYKNLVSLPEADSVMASGGSVLRLRYATWNEHGKLSQMNAVDAQSGIQARTSLFYDNYGNLIHYRLPMNDNGERVNYMIRYENDLHALPDSIVNQFGECKQIEYNPRWGLPVKTIDPDGAEITYNYDYMGRLTHVLAPQEKLAFIQDGWLPDDSNVPYTVRYTYNNIRHNLADLSHDTILHTYVLKQQATSWEYTPVTEATIYSARGEQLQKKKRTEINGHTGVILTDGVHEQEILGRVAYTRYPSISNTELWEYDDTSNSTGGDWTFVLYDVLDRDTLTTLPDGEEIRKNYSIDADCNSILRLRETITDPLSHATSTYKSPQGRTTSMVTADGSTTCYDYNCIGELTRVMDADNYSTTYLYNGFGQLIERNHPDAGKTCTRYDATGNIVCTRTQKQIDINDSTTYHYYFGRLMEIHHTQHVFENVTFNYDMAGRLAWRKDRTGSERIWYDEFGKVRKTLRRIIVPGEVSAFQFMTNYTYDSFGRIRLITYPDGENLEYDYYSGTGNLYDVKGLYIRATNIQHDELEHITHKEYYNGCLTDYQYNPDRQWMDRLITKSQNDANTIFQDLQYVHDRVGNITFVDQVAAPWHGMGGAYGNEYIYDSRYRLARNLYYDTYINSDYRMTYSPTTRIGSKYSDNHDLGDPYLIYGYDDSGLTHQPRVIHDFYSNAHLQLYWDRNGNLRQIQPIDGYTRFHLWDDDNQLVLSVGPTTCGYYGNASDGKRVYKLTGTFSLFNTNGGTTTGEAIFDNAVLYPNPYMTLTHDGYTKHYFMGSERIGTTIGGGGNNWLVSPLDNLTMNEVYFLKDLGESYLYQHAYYDFYDYPHQNSNTANTDYTGLVTSQYTAYRYYQYKEGELYYGNIDLYFKESLSEDLAEYYSRDKDDEPYYYHSDHLGSASWITDNSGTPVQYVMYAPYGEQMQNQHPYSYRERFTFTGKERDEETGYDYFGARYYLPIISIFGSIDPLANKYIYNSPYIYCDGNPIKFVDPDGRIIRFAPGTTTAQKEMFWQAVRYLDSHNCGGRFGQLKKSRYTYIINMNVEKSQFKPNEQTINWLPDQGLETDNGTIMSPATVLNHEMTHATHYDNAVEQYNKGNTQAFEEYNNSLQPNTSENYDSLEEESVITGIEQRTAQALGEVGPDQVTRTNHKGNPVKVESPISNKKVEE